jgi:hypothetical protein
MQHSKPRLKIILQDFAERYFQYIYDLCKRKFSSWEIRDAYIGGLESTTNLNSAIQLQNVEHATKLFPDIQDVFRRVFNAYMGKDEDCRLAKRKHLFQYFLQDFLAEMSTKLIQKQSDDSTVRDIMNMLSAEDRRVTVDFCFQKALASTAKYDSDIMEEEITSEDSISIIGSGKEPTAFQLRQKKDLEKASLASSKGSGLTKDMLATASAIESTPSIPSTVKPPASSVKSAVKDPAPSVAPAAPAPLAPSVALTAPLAQSVALHSVHSIPLIRNSPPPGDSISDASMSDEDDDSSISREYSSQEKTQRKNDFDRFDVLKRKFNAPPSSGGSSSQSSVFSNSSVSSSFAAASAVSAASSVKPKPKKGPVKKGAPAAKPIRAQPKNLKKSQQRYSSESSESSDNDDNDDYDDNASVALSSIADSSVASSAAASSAASSVAASSAASSVVKRKPVLNFRNKK